MMKGYDEKICRHALNRIFGNNPRAAHSVIGHFGSASEVFSRGAEALREAMPYSRYPDRISDAEYEFSERELSRIRKEGYEFITNDSPAFPARLKECPDHSIGLYIRSSDPPESIFADRPCIAVVGTRDSSPYGRTECRNIVRALASTPEKPAIISGLASGIDITAHRAALDFGLATIAVIPSGIGDVYPKRHYGEAARIAGTAGCAVVTDFPPGTPVTKYNFLRRNRIIAGMCDAAILAESRIKGGGMMTARLAFSYSRDVYALPGRIDEPRSQGCNLLIHDGMAEPVISMQSLCSGLGLTAVPRRAEEADDKAGITETYSGSMSSEDTELLAVMLSAIRRRSGISIDELAEECGTDCRHASELAGMLESDGFISTDLMRRCSVR